MERRVADTIEAEYVVVGAGSAGCVIASRLAEQQHTVVLIEAGGSDQRRLVRRPGLTAPMHTVPSIQRTLDWGYKTTPQVHALDRMIPQYRGRIMGGSSSVNGMLWVRGNRANYDEWAALGNKGWDADTVNDLFRRIEDFEDGPDDYRGAGGPVGVTRSTTPTEASLQFIEQTSSVLGVPVLADYNGAEQEGASRFQVNVANGVRQSSSHAYLSGRELPTLTILKRRQAAKIVISNGRAVGVETFDKRGRRLQVRASREVIVSAGVFGSPQLLMLSGIGPQQHLAEHGIRAVADLPVGQNLHDHMFVPVTAHADVPGKGIPGFFAAAVVRDLLGRETFLRTSMFEAVAFVRSSLATSLPDIQLHVLPWSYPSPNSDSFDVYRDPVPSITVHSTLIYPKSRGSLRLACTDPRQSPLIDFNYLQHPDDAEVLAQGIERVREVMASPGMRRLVRPELHPGRTLTGDALRDEMRLRATTVFHGVGTCRMGVDERCVVDPELRVRGVEGLRVADASVMPTITGGNTNAPSVMIGEKAAELLVASASRSAA